MNKLPSKLLSSQGAGREVNLNWHYSRNWRSGMKKKLLKVQCAWLLLIISCAAPPSTPTLVTETTLPRSTEVGIQQTETPAPGPKLASSAEDIVGTWQSTASSVEVQINEDGTIHAQSSSTGEINELEFRFEGTRFFQKNSRGLGCTLEGHETGIYDVELFENGNLKYIVIEDECLTRVNYLAGRIIEVEWEPVP